MEKEGGESNLVIACKPLTTFVQTDTTTFREVVQRLTGPSESHTPPPSKALGSKWSTTTSKLHERRHLTRPKLQIVKPCPSHFKPTTASISADQHPSCISSPVATPSKILSKLSIEDGEKDLMNNKEEEKAIKERRFYLHPSPRSMRGYAQPELLSLFPLESPKTSNTPRNIKGNWLFQSSLLIFIHFSCKLSLLYSPCLLIFIHHLYSFLFIFPMFVDKSDKNVNNKKKCWYCDYQNLAKYILYPGYVTQLKKSI